MLPLLFFAASLPHVEQVGPGSWAVGFADKYGSANCGWVIEGETVTLVDLPHGVTTADYLAEVFRITSKKPTRLLLTAPGASPMVAELEAAGVAKSVVPFAWFDKERVLFAGSLVTNGPRAPLNGRDTAAWIADLDRLAKLPANATVPGRGSWGERGLIERQRRFLTEIRRQVGYAISMGRPLATIEQELLLPASYYTWMPYDTPNAADVRHVYAELTAAPRFPAARPRALVLIADRFHEPEHLEAGLRPAIQAAGVHPVFTVDVTQLNAANLAQADVLIILRDGMLWPDGPSKPYKIWMTPEQEKAVVDFTEGGKAFLNLHNSMGLYPENGPYLNLVAGRYIGHGPLERFRVEVADKTHPITRGVSGYFAADEQHTPPFDEKKAHLLLRNRSDDGKTAAAGWAYEPGKGRLVHLASGHTREALEHPMYQLLVKNALNWLLRR